MFNHMTVPIKALLIGKEEKLGNGLAVIREKESEMISIDDYEVALSDATSSGNPARIIKNNKVYKVIKTYFDLDKNARIILAKEEENGFDIWPLPPSNEAKNKTE